MATQIQLTRSGTAAAIPAAAEMELGEVALNYADGKLFFKNLAGQIEQLNSTYNNSGKTIFVNDVTDRVGLNTITPNFLLDLGGDSASTANTLRLNQNDGGTAIRIGGSANGDITLLRVDNLDGITDSAAEGFSIKYLGSNSNNELAVFTDNQSGSAIQALTILQNGNIGIGVATPSNELDVAGTIKVTDSTNFITLNNGSEDMGFILNNGGKLAINAGGTTDVLQLQTNGGTRVHIDNVGKVGIGTTTPLAPLHVDQSVPGAPSLILQGADPGLHFLDDTNQTQSMRMRYNGAASTGGMRFTMFNDTTSTLGATVFQIDTNGDVTTPGNITATGTATAATPTADTHLTTKAYVDSYIKNIAFKSLDGRGARSMSEGLLSGYTQNNVPTTSNSYTFSTSTANAEAYYLTANSVLSSAGVLAQGIVTRGTNSNFLINTTMNVGLYSANHHILFRVEYSVNSKSNWKGFNLPLLDNSINQGTTTTAGSAVGHASVCGADLNEDIHTVNINQFLSNATYTAGDTIHFRVMMMAYYLDSNLRTTYINRPENLQAGQTGYTTSSMMIEEIYTQ